ncbi:MAG: hypothetical protein ACRC6A_01500 [Fusobacteriaceae bacterium]
MKKLMIIIMILVSSFAYSSGEVYIVENGKAYHATKSCTSLRKSKNIKAVAISEVGNRKPCRFKNCK